jgi:glycosyltransferase involved in cell wall biosynthesis
MNIVFFTHPTFLGSQSMPRFANYLCEGMRARGHQVAQWSPTASAYKLSTRAGLKKWLGYVDQYLLFPREVSRRIKACPADTLFVFTDQALGPWVPLVANRPHVIHCHDFLAQHSALGRIAENPTSWTGRTYQALIRRGYTQGANFISVSQTTKKDLHQFLPTAPASSEVVYNGLNQLFTPFDTTQARRTLSQKTGLDLSAGYLLHVGGNQWYKNRLGCIELYDAWRKLSASNTLPLLLVGEAPSEVVTNLRNASAFKQDIHLLSGFDDEAVRLAYAGATVFLFPSLAEGFGWPIAEAMAAGCPVLTTQEAPMTEVGGTAAYYIPRRPTTAAEAWATAGAHVIQQVVDLSPAERQAAVAAGQANARRFESEAALDQIEAIYKTIVPSPSRR